MTSIEALSAKGGDAFRDCDGGEGGTTIEAKTVNTGKGRRKSDGSEGRTTTEAIDGDGFDSFEIFKPIKRFNISGLVIK